MIAFIKGNVVFKKEDSIVVENQGIGYQIYVPSPFSFSTDTVMTIFTYQHVREDAILLFGFASEEDLQLFIKLISVKGVGPKTAIHMLSVCPAKEMIQAIEEEDIARLKSLPGIGAKTASQIILDLKGKFISNETSGDQVKNTELTDAMDALLALGYKQKELSKIKKELEKEELLTCENYIRKGLSLLSKVKGA